MREILLEAQVVFALIEMTKYNVVGVLKIKGLFTNHS
jgi:hypothetical protein